VLRQYYPAAREAKVIHSHIVRMPHSTFAQRPGTAGVRPEQRTSVKGLALAGDWPRTDWTTTMEGACQGAARAVAAGAFVALAHPQWSGLTLADARSITAAHAVEVYNTGCDFGCDRPDGFGIADLLLTEGRRLTLIATDDAHFSEPDFFGGWVMVKSEENTPEALLAALKAGHFYSSQGPELRDVRIEGDKVVVESSAVVSVVAIGHGTGAKGVHGQSMTRTEVPLARLNNSPWVRVAVIDAAGKRAWSNPIWVDGPAQKNPRVLA